MTTSLFIIIFLTIATIVLPSFWVAHKCSNVKELICVMIGTNSLLGIVCWCFMYLLK